MIKKKTIWIMAAIILGAALVIGLLYLNSIIKYQNAINNISFEKLELRTIAEGVYTGEWDVDFIYAKTAVTIKDGKIQSA